MTDGAAEPAMAEVEQALGAIVLESAYLERVLRITFSALLGSKYAAVVDGRLTLHALIENCEAIVKVHQQIAESDQTTLLAALAGCLDASKRRNRAVHDAWALRPGGRVVALQSYRHSREVPVTAQTVRELRELADDLGSTSKALQAAVRTALGPQSLDIEDQLRQELGHEVGAEPNGM